VLFRVLGPLEVIVDRDVLAGLGRRRERCLLGLLLLEANRLVPMDRLVSLLWDDQPPPNARRTLHAHVARLRAGLAAHSPAPQLV
jgi:DNA-binding SARP family transcriptional activator